MFMSRGPVKWESEHLFSESQQAGSCFEQLRLPTAISPSARVFWSLDFIGSRP